MFCSQMVVPIASRDCISINCHIQTCSVSRDFVNASHRPLFVVTANVKIDIISLQYPVCDVNAASECVTLHSQRFVELIHYRCSPCLWQVPDARVLVVGTHADHPGLTRSILEEIWDHLRRMLVDARDHHRRYFSPCSTPVYEAAPGQASAIKMQFSIQSTG